MLRAAAIRVLRILETTFFKIERRNTVKIKLVILMTLLIIGSVGSAAAGSPIPRSFSKQTKGKLRTTHVVVRRTNRRNIRANPHKFDIEKTPRTLNFRRKHRRIRGKRNHST